MKIVSVILLSCFFSLALHAEDTEYAVDGYTTYEQAYEALKKNSQAKFSEDQGWTIVSIENGNDFIVWTFTPTTHSAHPAVIKRKMVKKNDAIYIDMKGICDAEKNQCDKLFEDFEKLNDKISQGIQPDV